MVETAILFFDYVCNNGLDIEKLREGADGHEGAVATYRKMKATINDFENFTDTDKNAKRMEQINEKLGRVRMFIPPRPTINFKKTQKRRFEKRQAAEMLRTPYHLQL